MRGEHAGDRVQHARAIGDVEAEEVLGATSRRSGGRCAVVSVPSDPCVPRAQVDGGVDDVAEHRAGGRRPTGAAAVEHQRVDEVALDEHRVEAVAHGGERVVDAAPSSGWTRTLISPLSAVRSTMPSSLTT